VSVRRTRIIPTGRSPPTRRAVHGPRHGGSEASWTLAWWRKLTSPTRRLYQTCRADCRNLFAWQQPQPPVVNGLYYNIRVKRTTYVGFQHTSDSRRVTTCTINQSVPITSVDLYDDCFTRCILVGKTWRAPLNTFVHDVVAYTRLQPRHTADVSIVQHCFTSTRQYTMNVLYQLPQRTQCTTAARRRRALSQCG